MGKPIPSLKRTSQIPVASMEAFVEGPATEAPRAAESTEVKGKKGRATAAKGRRVQSRKDGAVLRKVTVYLPQDLDRQLSIFAVTNDADRSNVVVEALTKFLRKL